MRALCCLAVLVLSAGVPAYAAEVPATSKIASVTVFPAGAEITRIMKVKLEAGEHSILLNDVTGQADPASIRVEAGAGSALAITSVDARRTELPSTDPAVTQSARKQLEDRIEKLGDERGELNDVVKVAEEQRNYLKNLEKLPQTPPAASASAPREDWSAVYSLIGMRMTELAKTARDAKLKQRELDRQIAELKKELAATGGKSQDRAEMRIYVKVPAPLETTLTLRYQVASALWTAFYDAQLTTGDKGAARKLSLARYASISQTTGEDWDDVALALSTTKPGISTAAPDLAMLSVDFEMADAKKFSLGQVQTATPNILEKRSYFDENNDLVRVKKVLLPASPQAQAQAQVIASTFQAVYAIPVRATIKTTGEAKRLQITAEEMEPALLVRTVPRLDHNAYLYAKFALPKASSPIMEGQVSLLRDGVHVGTGKLPQLAPGEEMELGFGADERVKVKRVVSEDKKGETGTFTTSRTEERSYTISVKNLHAHAVEMQVIDRIPVPMHQDIKLDFTQTKGPQPTAHDVDDKRGTMLWQMTANPDEEKLLAFGYRITAPADKRLHFRELGDEELQANQMMKR